MKVKIVPIDITHKSFNRKVMGYDPSEVSEFLNAVAQELESAIHERNRLKEALREKELQLLEYKDRDRVLKDTITTAQKMSERIKSESDREAQMILQDAHHKAEMIVRDSRDSLKNVYRDINDLKKIKLQFEANLKAMIQTHLDLLGKQDQYLPRIPEPKTTERGALHQFEIK
jgi:cell division initiation protein